MSTQHTLWKGAISFGLVNVPVRMHRLTASKTVRFKQLNGKTGNRIEQRRFDTGTGEPVEFTDLVKGYELANDDFVVVDPAELRAVAPTKTQSITIDRFVDPSEISTVLYKDAHWLAPVDGEGEAAYSLFVRALDQSGKVAVGTVVIRSQEKLVVVRADPSGSLIMSTLCFADEVQHMADVPNGDVAAAELEMAGRLIESKSGAFDPGRYADGYREQVVAMIEAKAAGQEVATDAGDVEVRPAPDLMAALEASIKEAN